MTDAEPNQDTKSDTPAPIDGEQRMIMGILAYLGPLVVVPYLMAKHDDFVKFHIRQGVVLFVFSIAIYVAISLTFFLPLYFLAGLLHVAYLIFLIIGVVHVVQKKTEPLPLIGTFATYVKL